MDYIFQRIYILYRRIHIFFLQEHAVENFEFSDYHMQIRVIS